MIMHVSSFAGRLCISACVFLSVAAGCSKPSLPPAKDNKEVVTSDGKFVGHLKPDKRAIAALGENVPKYDPVVWVVDGDEVYKPDQELSVHLFRLDFDELQPITEATLPFALMTKNSRQIIIHRGPPPDNFSHPTIAGGEACLPIFVCTNLECPRVKEISDAPLFPHDASSGEPTCPFCGKHEAVEYKTPQHVNMMRFMEYFDQ